MAGINHVRVVAHQDKGVASDWNADHKQTGNHDCEQHQHLNHVWENRTDWPAGPVVGQVVYRTDFNNFFGWNGTAWQSLTPVATIVVAADGTGNYLTIQEGIDALPAGGGVVYVKEGTYTITSAIDLNKNNIALIGAGKSSKILTNSNITMLTSSNKSSLLIEKFWIYGAGSGNNSNYGVAFDTVFNSQVSDCWIEHCGMAGIVLDSSDRNLFLGNNITTCSIAGIYVYASDYNAFSLNTIYSCQYGISLYESDYNTIGINIIYSNLNAGIRNFNANYNIISNNQIYSNVYEGVYLFGSSNNVISNNEVRDNDVNNTATYDGIIVSGNYNLIECNRCMDNDRYEINIVTGALDNIVSGNNCIGTDHVGAINDNGTNTLPNGARGTTNLALDDLNIMA